MKCHVYLGVIITMIADAVTFNDLSYWLSVQFCPKMDSWATPKYKFASGNVLLLTGVLDSVRQM